MMINLGALEKDRAGPDTGLLTIARNAYPTTIGWGPMPTLAENGTAALPSRCLGLFFARQQGGGYRVFAGTVSNLYEFVSSAWVDRTRTVGGNYAVPVGNYWQATQWGSLFIVVNGADAPQVLDVDGGGTAFTALAGSPPNAIYARTVGDFVFLVDGTNRRRAMNCGTTGPNTATSWTVGTDLCDEYIAPDGGNIASAPMLGEYGLVLQDGGIARRISLQPGDAFAAFRFEKIEGIKGCVGGYSVVEANGKVFYLAEDGIYSLSPDGSNTPVGSQRIDKEFRDTTDISRIDQFYAFADPFSTRIYWACYKSASSTVFDVLLGYDWMLDRLFFVDASADFWAGIVVPGMTLEELAVIYPDLDTMPVSLDSRQFAGGRPTLAAINSSSKLALLTGSNATATIRVSPTHLSPPNRALLTKVYPIGEWNEAEVTLRVGKREHMGQSSTWVGPFTKSSETGEIHTRASARLHELELTIAGDGWVSAKSLGTTEQPDGER